MSTPKTPTTKQYQHYLESYGPDLQKWPDVDLKDAAHWLANSVDMQDEIAAQTQLDALLYASLDDIKAPRDLSEKILSMRDAEEDAPSNMFGFIGTFSARAYAPLFAAAFVGVLLGVYLPEFLLSENSTSADEIILYESFIDWDGETDNG
jgi:hypothetical protein